MDDAEAPQARSAERPRPRVRRTLTAVVAGLAVTLAGLGIAAAQTGQGDTPTTTTVPTDGERGPCHGRHARRAGLAAAANAIGISGDELRNALRSGQSIAQVAQSKSVDVQKVIDAMVEEARRRLAAKVQSGDLTQAQADEKLANIMPRITAFVNRTGGRGHN